MRKKKRKMMIKTKEAKVEAEKLKKKGNALFKENDNEGAIVVYSQGIELDTQNWNLYFNRAAAYIKLKKYSEAAMDAEKSALLNPLHVDAHLRLGQCLAKIKKKEEAKRAFEAALALDKENVAAKKALEMLERPALSQEIKQFLKDGDEMYKKKEYAQAVALYSKGLEMDSKIWNLRFNRCAAYLRLKDYVKAMEDARVTVELEPKSSESHLRLAQCLHKQSLLKEALESYGQAIALDPKNTSAKAEMEKLQEELANGNAQASNAGASSSDVPTSTTKRNSQEKEKEKEKDGKKKEDEKGETMAQNQGQKLGEEENKEKKEENKEKKRRQQRKKRRKKRNQSKRWERKTFRWIRSEEGRRIHALPDQRASIHKIWSLWSTTQETCFCYRQWITCVL